MRQYRHVTAVIAALVPLVVFCGQAASSPVAQGVWSEPIEVYAGAGGINEPVVVVDDWGEIHILWQVFPSDENGQIASIWYAECGGGTCSPAIDVMASTEAASPVATSDRRGLLHLVWHGPGNALYYAKTSLGAEISAQNWSVPYVLGSSLQHAHIARDDQDNLYVAFPSPETGGVSLRISHDGGDSWSRLLRVADAFSADATSDWVRLAVDEAGGIHVVWSEFRLPSGWPPTGVFYARSTDAGLSWSEPVQLAGEGHDQANVATGAAQRVYVAWNGAAGTEGRYLSVSNDRGQTWAKPAILVPDPTIGGSSGPPQIGVDSGGNVHIVFAWDRRVWHLPWNGTDRGPLVDITQGIASVSNYIEQPAMTIEAGYRLHAVFWDDRRGLWYRWADVAAPSPQAPPLLPTKAIANAEQVSRAPTGIPEPPPQVTILPSPIAGTAILGEVAFSPSPSVLPVALGIGGGLVFIGLSLLVRKLSRNR